MNPRRRTAPPATGSSHERQRKRKGRDHDTVDDRSAGKRRRAPDPTHPQSRNEDSNHSRLDRLQTTRDLPDSQRLTPSQLPVTFDHFQQAPHQQPEQRSTDDIDRPKTTASQSFFLRGYSPEGPVNEVAAGEIIRGLKQLRCLDDLFATAPHEIFSVARMIVESYYHSIACFENRPFQRDTPAGADLVGRIGLFIVPLLRGDPRPLNFRDNRNVMPGPYDTHIMVKIVPALIYNNDHRDYMIIKPFTTKHNTDAKKLHDSGELKRDFVLISRTTEEKHASTPSCFATLKFVATSDSYDYESPCYMSVIESLTYPRRSPWMDLGYLASGIDHVVLDHILREASSRLAAPNLSKAVNFSATTFNHPSLHPPKKGSQDLLDSLIIPAPIPELDTVIPKVVFSFQRTRSDQH